MKTPLSLMGYNLMSCETGPRDNAIVPDNLPELAGGPHC